MNEVEEEFNGISDRAGSGPGRRRRRDVLRGYQESDPSFEGRSLRIQGNHKNLQQASSLTAMSISRCQKSTIPHEELQIRPLSKKDVLTGFNCGDDEGEKDLNDFLIAGALLS
ncbi:MAG: hypothetical protein GKC10_08230 [Methanosarcinales archaeon]|nr:hypothetical protein [Methanosarcinales archaeon]